MLETWDGPGKPWEGFELIPADGHRRGQQLVRVSGPEGALYYVAVLIPFAAHVRIPFVMGYDMAAIETMAEKRALLERACGENAWICLEHDPDVALARPVAEGEEFAWREKVPAAVGVGPGSSRGAAPAAGMAWPRCPDSISSASPSPTAAWPRRCPGRT